MAPEKGFNLREIIRDNETEVGRPIQEYPFYSNRLLDIDYEKIIAEGK